MHTFQSVYIILGTTKGRSGYGYVDAWQACLLFVSAPHYSNYPVSFSHFTPLLLEHLPASSTSLFALVSSPASPMEFPLPALLPIAQGLSQLLMMCIFSSSPFPKDLTFIPLSRRTDWFESHWANTGRLLVQFYSSGWLRRKQWSQVTSLTRLGNELTYVEHSLCFQWLGI